MSLSPLPRLRPTAAIPLRTVFRRCAPYVAVLMLLAACGGGGGGAPAQPQQPEGLVWGTGVWGIDHWGQ